MRLIEHDIALAAMPGERACAVQYVWARDGIVIRAKRVGLIVTLPYLFAPNAFAELLPVAPHVQLTCGRVSVETLLWLHAQARTSRGKAFSEMLFLARIEDGGYVWSCPKQHRSAGSVALARTPDRYGDVLIELHTHPAGAHDFSRAADDVDEFGFRIYSLLADVDTPHPAIRTRISVHGRRCGVSSSLVYTLPEGWRDLVTEEVNEVWQCLT